MTTKHLRRDAGWFFAGLVPQSIFSGIILCFSAFTLYYAFGNYQNGSSYYFTYYYIGAIGGFFMFLSAVIGYAATIVGHLSAGNSYAVKESYRRRHSAFRFTKYYLGLIITEILLAVIAFLFIGVYYFLYFSDPVVGYQGVSSDSLALAMLIFSVLGVPITFGLFYCAFKFPCFVCASSMIYQLNAFDDALVEKRRRRKKKRRQKGNKKKKRRRRRKGKRKKKKGGGFRPFDPKQDFSETSKNIMDSIKLKKLEEKFKAVDTDGDGRISRSELYNVYKNLNKGLSDLELNKYLDEVFEHYDINNDGVIDREEFKSLYNDMYGDILVKESHDEKLEEEKKLISEQIEEQHKMEEEEEISQKKESDEETTKVENIDEKDVELKEVEEKKEKEEEEEEEMKKEEEEE